MATKEEEALRRLGSRVRQVRRQRKLSRHVAAELAGLHENTLKAIELGRGNPTFRVLLKIADVLSSTVIDLLGR